MKPLEPLRQLYISDVFICIGKKEAQSVYKTFGFEDKLDFDDSVDATTYHIEGDRIIIYYSKNILKTRKTEQAALIAHESYHASQRLKSIIREDDPAEETIAYLIQYLVRQTMKKLKQESKK